MLKFTHKKHLHHSSRQRGIVIYYDLSEIILGFLLIALVGFFGYYYLQNNLFTQPLQINSGSSQVQSLLPEKAVK